MSFRRLLDRETWYEYNRLLAIQTTIDAAEQLLRIVALLAVIAAAVRYLGAGLA